MLERLPRGRYELQDVNAVLEDPFGLARVEAGLDAASTILVYPRLVELERLFSDAGASLPEGRRLLMHKTSGFDLHSVRDYQQGESLRRVHWRSTAKRARLMVKELEDAPRDEVAVLLDARAGARAFDLQVRAAGSILFAHASRNRRAVLIVNGATQESVQTTASDGDRRRALEVLAAAEPDGMRPAESLLLDEAGPALAALELVVVTARSRRRWSTGSSSGGSHGARCRSSTPTEAVIASPVSCASRPPACRSRSCARGTTSSSPSGSGPTAEAAHG